MSVVKDLLGRLFWDGAETPNAAALAGKIEELRAELGHAEEMRAFYAAERQRLLPVMSRDELRDADRLAADAQNDVDRLRAQIAALETEHAAAVEREAHAKFEADKVALADRSADLTRRLQTVFPEHAKALGDILREVTSFEKACDDLATLGRELGRHDWLVKHPEHFRASPGRWVGRWPNPDGPGVVQGNPKDAPRGTFKWDGNRPIPAHEKASVDYRPAPPPESLVRETRIPGHYAPPVEFHLPPLPPDIR